MRTGYRRFLSRTLLASLALVLASVLSTLCAAADSLERDESAYVGLWHASPVVGSGFSDRLLLRADHTFLWAANQMDERARTFFRCGTWMMEDGRLILATDEVIRLKDGEDNDTELVELTEPEEEVSELGSVAVDAGVMGKKTVIIGGTQYWELSHPIDVEDMDADYAVMRGQAQIINRDQ